MRLPLVSRRTVPWLGVAVFAAIAAVFAYGFRIAGDPDLAWYVSLSALLSTGFAVLLARARLTGWLAAFVLGLAVGVLSALDLFLGPLFERQFFAALITFVTYAVLGFAVGAFLEFIRTLHRLSHHPRNKAKTS